MESGPASSRVQYIQEQIQARSCRPPIDTNAAIISLPNNPIEACRLLAGQAVQTRTPQKIADEPGGPFVRPKLARNGLQPCPHLRGFGAFDPAWLPWWRLRGQGLG